MRRSHGTLRGLPGSSRQQCRCGSPKPPPDALAVTVVQWGALAGPPVCLPHGQVLGFPVAWQITTPEGLASVHYTFKPAASPPAPSAPRVTPTHWTSATELQRPKL